MLPLKYTFQNWLTKVKNPRSSLSPEAYLAYFHKLPKKIQVEWFRDGKFIIGKIQAEGSEFMTQARSAKEFVEMVNDAVFTAYDVPLPYFQFLESRKFKPPQIEFDKLNNAAIKSSTMSFTKDLATA